MTKNTQAATSRTMSSLLRYGIIADYRDTSEEDGEVLAVPFCQEDERKFWGKE